MTYILHGGPRSFRTVFWLGVLTLGIFWAVYWFVAFREVDRQRGRRHSPLFFLGFVPLLGIAFAALYVHREYGLLLGDLQELGLKAPASQREVTAWIAPGFLTVVGPALSLHFVTKAVNSFWRELAVRGGVPAAHARRR